MAIDRDGGIGLLLGEDVVDRLAHLGELRRIEIGLAPHRREARRDQQRIVLAQRNVERGREPQDHVAARRGAAELEEAEMALRNLRATGKLELRPAAAMAPVTKLRREFLLTRHLYLPGSCGHAARPQHCTRSSGTTGDSGGRMARRADRHRVERAGRHGRGGDALSRRRQRRSAHACRSCAGASASCACCRSRCCCACAGRTRADWPARRAAGLLLLRAVLHLLQPRGQLHDGGAGKPRALDPAVADHDRGRAARHRAR